MSSAILDGSRLKDLNTKLQKEIGERAVCELNIGEYRKKVREHNDNIARIKKRIEGIGKTEGLQLTEHAILRYIERVELIPVQDVRNRIVTENLQRMFDILGDGCFPIDNSEFSVVIKNGQIITVKK